MSAAADKYERDVGDYLQLIGLDASRPKVSSKYSDILIKHNNKKIWLEVKIESYW